MECSFERCKQSVRPPVGHSADLLHAFAQQDIAERPENGHQADQTDRLAVQPVRKFHAPCVSVNSVLACDGIAFTGADGGWLFAGPLPLFAYFNRSARKRRKETASWNRRLRSCASQRASRTIRHATRGRK